MKKISFSIICLICFVTTAFSQRGNNTSFHPTVLVNDSIKTVPIYLLPSNFYTLQLGFFCKKELLVEKIVKFPVKFRLGSVTYCDAMEGKHTSYRVLPKVSY